jgi:hypothetical protein
MKACMASFSAICTLCRWRRRLCPSRHLEYHLLPRSFKESRACTSEQQDNKETKRLNPGLNLQIACALSLAFLGLEKPCRFANDPFSSAGACWGRIHDEHPRRHHRQGIHPPSQGDDRVKGAPFSWGGVVGNSWLRQSFTWGGDFFGGRMQSSAGGRLLCRRVSLAWVC